MRSFSYLAVSCICSIFLAETAVAESIPVFNAGFEDPPGAGAGIGLHPGWTRSEENGDVGIWQPGASDFENIPDGTQVAYVKFGDGYLAQSLAAELTADIRYELSAFVGRYRGASAPGYAVQLFAGDHLLAQSTSPIPESSQFVESTAVFTATEGNPQIGTNLEIRLLSTDPRGESNWAHFDDVRLNAVTLPLAAIGDFNKDGELTADDVDLLTAEIVARPPNLAFDVSGDGVVDDKDLTTWLSDAAEHNGFSQAYLAGDSNLDGSVDAGDLNNLALNWRQDLSLWSAGDFNADGSVGAGDLNELALNWRQSIPMASAVSAPVPEPSAWLLALFGLSLVCRRPRHS